MATEEKARPKSKAGNSKADGPEAGANIDQIRDIIFGTQMREYNQRFAALEERLINDSIALREDLSKRLTALEQYMKKEMEALGANLRAEQQSRAAAVKELAAGQVEMAKSADKRFADGTAAADKAQREIRSQLMEQAKALRDEAHKKAAEIAANLRREAADLREVKADRSALAALFTEMAARLANGDKRQNNG
jgi:cytochrome c556